jgi:hypothetical protein
MVLDGVAPGSLTLEQSFYQQGVAYDDSLRRFVADCLHQSDCPLSGTVANGIARIQKFLSDLDAKPIPAGPGRVLTEGLATPGIYYALYSGRDGWTGLRSSLTSAFAGDGSDLIGNVDAVYGRQPDGTYTGNGFPAFYAITCTDTPELGGPHHIATLALDWKKTATVFGESQAWAMLPCWHWAPVATSKPALPIFHATGSAAILLVATTHDPSTPTRVVWRSPRSSTTPPCSPTTATDIRPTAAGLPASTPQSTPISSKEPCHHTELGAPQTHDRPFRTRLAASGRYGTWPDAVQALVPAPRSRERPWLRHQMPKSVTVMR